MLRPFAVRAWVTTDMGITDRELRFDEKISTQDDVDLSLQCLVKWGVIWRDHRYYPFHQGATNGKLTGGIAHIRNTESVKAGQEYMRRKWGDDIVKGRSERGLATGIVIEIPK